MGGGGETGKMEQGTEGNNAGKNGVARGADEGHNAGDRQADCRRSGMCGTSNEGKVGSVALRHESEGTQFLVKAETVGIAACSMCNSNIGRESVGDGLVAGEGASTTDSRGGDNMSDESADDGGVVSTETSRDADT